MDDHFKRFPSVEIIADAFEPLYRIKYIECVEELGVVRFVKHEVRMPRGELDDLVGSIFKRAGVHRG